MAQNCNPDCGCPIKDLSTDCSLYTGENLPNSGVEKNTILTTVIKMLDGYILSKFNEVIQYLTLKNVGLGAKIFKGINGIGEKEIRSIQTGNTNLLEINEGIDEISLNPANLSLEFDILTNNLILKATNSISETILTTLNLPISSDAVNSIINVNYNPVTNILQFIKEDLTTTDIDLSNLDNKLESGVYDTVNKRFVFTLTDASTVNVNVQTLIDEIVNSITIPVAQQSDFTEENNTLTTFIKNKNPNKTVILGASGNYGVVDVDNNFVIEIDNGVNNVTINLTTITKTNNFFVGFVQKGSGTVTINGFTIKPQGLSNIILGQGHIASCEIIASTKYLLGNLKAE